MWCVKWSVTNKNKIDLRNNNIKTQHKNWDSWNIFITTKTMSHTSSNWWAWSEIYKFQNNNNNQWFILDWLGCALSTSVHIRYTINIITVSNRTWNLPNLPTAPMHAVCRTAVYSAAEAFRVCMAHNETAWRFVHNFGAMQHGRVNRCLIDDMASLEIKANAIIEVTACMHASWKFSCFRFNYRIFDI